MPTVFDVRALSSVVRIELDDALSDAEQHALMKAWSDVTFASDDLPTETIQASLGDAANLDASTSQAPRIQAVTRLADRLASEVTLRAISGLKGDALMLHAGAIALADGRVIGLVGPSGRGKTTASRALGGEYAYVTDETLAIRPDGRVISYQKPLSLGDRPGTKRVISASGLGLRTALADYLRLGAIVLLDRRADITTPYVEVVSLRDAISELVPQTSYLHALDRPLRMLVEIIQSTGGIRRVVYSEAATLPSLIETILTTEHNEDVILTDVASNSTRDCDCYGQMLPWAPIGTDTPFDEARPGAYRRTSHEDSLMVDDTLWVLQRHMVFILEGLGPLVWLAADDSTEDELRDAVLRQLPAPPGVDAAKAVAAAVSELRDVSLLVQRVKSVAAASLG